MLKNHLKLAWRNLRKYPVYSFLNLGGLALGIAAAFVLALYVRQELTYDQHFEDNDRIYRVATDFFDMGGFANSQQQLLEVLPQETPILEETARLQRGGNALPVVVGEQVYEEPNYLYGDSTFFQVFAYRFLAGDPETALHAPDEIILSEPLAEKYFGDESAIGQVLLVGKEQEAYRVSGVVEVPAGKTHFVADFWLPLVPQDPNTNWTNASYYNYVKLRPDATQADLERVLEAVRQRHAYPASGFSGSFEEWSNLPTAVEFFVQPLTDIYLHSTYNFELGPGGSPTQVYVLGLIGVFILLIAGMNYVNLTTARSSIRAKEVGVKKTLGAGQPALVQQFLAETIVFSLLAMVIAAGMAEGMLAAFSYITGTVLLESVFANGWHLLTLFGFSVTVGLLAGIYPAFYLSSFRPVKILKGEWAVSRNHRLRSSLVVVQFAIATALIISSLAVYQQLDFMQHTDKGFAPEGVLLIENTSELGEQVEAFRQQLEQLPQVEQSSYGRRIPTGRGVWMATFATPEMEQSITIQTFPGDEDYIETLGMRLIEGRGFSGDLASDSTAVILNEAAVRALGLGDEPLGKQINPDQYVIGVISDFHFQSLRDQIEPVVLTYDAGGYLIFRLQGRQIADFMDQMPTIWQQFTTEPIRYSFLDDNFMQLAEQERMLSKAVSFFTLLALVIACMGLFGLTAFTVQRRTKEIGIRKVLGAGRAGLVVLLSKDFLKLVIMAFVLAAPAAYYALRSWLEGFAYRIDLGAGVFLMAGGLALLIALLTVSYHAFRTAAVNPVKSLRYE